MHQEKQETQQNQGTHFVLFAGINSLPWYQNDANIAGLINKPLRWKNGRMPKYVDCYLSTTI
jgi:hypothetical protein